jgi:hypothetical protein
VVQFGDESAADRVYGTAGASGGGLYLAGYTSGSVDGTPNAGDKDAVVAKVSAAGELLWTRQLGGAGEDKAQAIVEGSEGEVYVAGVTSAAMPDASGNGGLDGWVAKLTPEGDLDWLQQIGTAESDALLSVTPDPAGGVVGVGYTGGVLGETHSGGNDALVVSIAADGTLRWIRQEGTLDDDRAAAATQSDDGSLVVAGHTAGRMKVSAGGVDVFVLTIDTVSGAVTGRLQTGTPFRDGADEWDEANLYTAPAGGGAISIAGLTYGSTTTDDNAGAGDVFSSRVAMP